MSWVPHGQLEHWGNGYAGAVRAWVRVRAAQKLYNKVQSVLEQMRGWMQGVADSGWACPDPLCNLNA